MVSEADRRQARQHDRDTSRLVRVGQIAARSVMTRALAATISAYRRGNGSPLDSGLKELRRLLPLLERDAEAAYLTGMARVARRVPGNPHGVKIAAALPLAQLNALRRGLQLTDSVLAHVLSWTSRIEQQRFAKLEEVFAGAMRESLERIAAEGAHVREGMGIIRDTFDACGLSPRNSFTVENLYRTEMQMNYQAGRWAESQDPVVQEILWGFTYVTVGDSRVRPTHAALEGTTLPKDDPRWQTIWPPNGWACRCSTIEIFEPREVVNPPATIEVGDRQMVVEPDKGFAFNPGSGSAPLRAA
jgi:SPP1 gp7 family putative phage head morphogenesis protein